MRADSNARVQSAITKAPIMYQTSPSNPGLIERIFEGGTRDAGLQKDGVFIRVPES